MSTNAELEDRIVGLELRFMTLEREVEQLSEVVRAQHRVIEALTDEARRRRNMDSAEVIANERPPHF